ncbi:PorT family protein [Hymenobacter busanensis]|uniref:PorT family protein n=1 Tax=Hymenobacter busanensis TaxID=2607656 RepID=A0A7L4ZZ19_9BACT|nr:porin family protein [Hymenobacter busanensis]KAA9333297.1 PorT family protein [Hymenobacter busanensis]QHJ08025.1 outer membrane beta-barrel protein [Hymenobacter busanensis]
MKTNRAYRLVAFSAALLLGASTASFAQIQPHIVGAPRSRPAPVRSAYSVSPDAANKADGVRFGIRAGVNVADWSGDAVQSVVDLAELTNGAITKEQRTGFHAGAYVSLPVGARFVIEPGLQYSEKGMALVGRVPLEQFDFLNAKVTATARMAYVELPVLAKAYLTPGLYLYAGPQASYLVSNKVRVQAGALGFSAYSHDFDVRKQFRDVDFSVTGGAGYQFANGLGLSAGYDYGLSSLDKNNRFDAQNRAIKASVNFTF